MSYAKRAAIHYISSFGILLLTIAIIAGTMNGTALPDLIAGGTIQDNIAPVIVIDAGHGGEDCGAVGTNGILEKDLNLYIARLVATLLRAAGYQVIETRTNDALLYDPITVEKGQKKVTDLKNRLLISEAQERAILVSIHMNSFPASPEQSGTQIWYGGENEYSFEVARMLQKYIVDEFGLGRKRSIMKSKGDLYLLDRSTHPAVILECGFLSNVEECAKLSDEKYRNELSFAIFCAMIDIINAYGGTT